MNGYGSSPTSPGAIFSLVRDGRASSRADVARLTGLAPSTVAMRIAELIDHGYLEEAGDGASRGGRRPRALRVARDTRVVVGVDLGTRHATVRGYDMGFEEVMRCDLHVEIDQPPESTLRQLDEAVVQLLARTGGERVLAGIGLAVPGPVRSGDGRVVSPSRMPGWNGIDPAAILGGIAGVPVRTENDANAMAVGEHIATGRSAESLIVVKAGSSIGTGIIAAGTLHRGSWGMAGDVSHTSVADGPPVVCSCGRLGCLDAVAGGRAIVTALRGAGVEIDEMSHVVALARDAHPLTTRLLREAGRRIGAVLATLVSFLNPERLVLAGSMSSTDAFVAGVRSSVYDHCLPMFTNDLEIAVSDAGPDLGARGAAALILDEVLDPARIDVAIRETH